MCQEEGSNEVSHIGSKEVVSLRPLHNRAMLHYCQFYLWGRNMAKGKTGSVAFILLTVMISLPSPVFHANEVSSRTWKFKYMERPAPEIAP